MPFYLQKERDMTINSQKSDFKRVEVIVDKNLVSTSFEKWSKPGHFSRILAKGPKNDYVDMEFTC